MSKLYQIKISQEDAIKACHNYLRYRRHKANKERLRIIRELMSPTKKYFGFISVDPKCKTVKDAIRYMKSTYDSIYWCSLWSVCSFTGSRWTNAVKELFSEIKTGKVQGEIYLTDSMSFLLKWVKP